MFGIDTIARLKEPLSPLVIHELFHVYHAERIPKAPEVFYWQMWEEGLASYVSRKLNPDVAESEVCCVPKAEPIDAVRGKVVAGALERLDSAKDEDYRRYFLGGKEEIDIPHRSGYLLGYRIAREAGKTRSLDALAELLPAEVRRLIESGLRSMQAGKALAAANTSRGPKNFPMRIQPSPVLPPRAIRRRMASCAPMTPAVQPGSPRRDGARRRRNRARRRGRLAVDVVRRGRPATARGRGLAMVEVPEGEPVQGRDVDAAEGLHLAGRRARRGGGERRPLVPRPAAPGSGAGESRRAGDRRADAAQARGDMKAFEAEWRRAGGELAADLKAPSPDAFAGVTPAAVRAIGEAALPQVRVFYDASLEYGRNTMAEAGFFYLASARSQKDFVAFCRSLARKDAGRDPALRSIAPEIDALESDLLALYRPPPRSTGTGSSSPRARRSRRRRSWTAGGCATARWSDTPGGAARRRAPGAGGGRRGPALTARLAELEKNSMPAGATTRSAASSSRRRRATSHTSRRARNRRPPRRSPTTCSRATSRRSSRPRPAPPRLPPRSP
jgi:hypothetical protein